VYFILLLLTQITHSVDYYHSIPILACVYVPVLFVLSVQITLSPFNVYCMAIAVLNAFTVGLPSRC
jgi:hypothetical protein